MNETSEPLEGNATASLADKSLADGSNERKDKWLCGSVISECFMSSVY